MLHRPILTPLDLNDDLHRETRFVINFEINLEISFETRAITA